MCFVWFRIHITHELYNFFAKDNTKYVCQTHMQQTPRYIFLFTSIDLAASLLDYKLLFFCSKDQKLLEDEIMLRNIYIYSRYFLKSYIDAREPHTQSSDIHISPKIDTWNSPSPINSYRRQAKLNEPLNLADLVSDYTWYHKGVCIWSINTNSQPTSLIIKSKT